MQNPGASREEQLAKKREMFGMLILALVAGSLILIASVVGGGLGD
jgi:hypothetical protein